MVRFAFSIDLQKKKKKAWKSGILFSSSQELVFKCCYVIFCSVQFVHGQKLHTHIQIVNINYHSE